MRPAAVLALAFTGCATLRGAGGGADVTRVESLSAEGYSFRIAYSPEDAEAVFQVKAAIRRAVPRVKRWGALSVPIAVTIYPTHDALEHAVDREGYAWLRAWARYRTIDVQSPRTWSIFGATDDEVAELFTHELTHCVMYQTSGSEWTWAYKAIPLWFREGLASVSAGQGYRRARPESIWRFYQGAGPATGLEGLPRPAANPAATRSGGDPVSDPEPLYQSESEVVYGAAHWAFQFLVDRYGEAKVRALLARMGDGHLFGSAFEDAIGISVEDFEGDFKRYVIWQGWR
jgi:hypothetical protein